MVEVETIDEFQTLTYISVSNGSEPRSSELNLPKAGIVQIWGFHSSPSGLAGEGKD